jgi:hypothetical protein
MNDYSDARYGVIQRHWFGLTKKCGGASADGFTFGSGDPGPDAVQVTRFYPKAPCNIIKFGSFNLATLTFGASTVDRMLCRLIGRGASASVMASLDIVQTVSPYAIASIESANTTDFPITQVKAGEYISITAATKETDKGTDLGSSLLGTVAFFVDMVPAYDAARWNPDPKQYQG